MRRHWLSPKHGQPSTQEEVRTLMLPLSLEYCCSVMVEGCVICSVVTLLWHQHSLLHVCSTSLHQSNPQSSATRNPATCAFCTVRGGTVRVRMVRAWCVCLCLIFGTCVELRFRNQKIIRGVEHGLGVGRSFLQSAVPLKAWSLILDPWSLIQSLDLFMLLYW